MQFIRRVAPGPITLSISPVNLGPRVSVIQIDLQSEQPEAGGFKSCVIATVTQGNLATEKGISLPTHPAVKKGDIPDRDRDCEDFVVSPATQQIAPVFMKLSGRVVKGGSAGWYSDHLGKSIREIWYTFADGTDFDVLSMGYLTDCVSFPARDIQTYIDFEKFGGAPNNFARDDEDYKSGVVYPTLSMATEIKKDPKGAKWLFMRIETHEIRNGRFDTNVVILDEKGELVALSNHVSLVLEKHSEEKLRRIYRL